MVATFHFHGEINYFLPKKRRDIPFQHPIHHKASIKDWIESLNPPHTEVGLIVVNGESVNFDFIIESEMQIDVYTDFDALMLPNKSRLHPPYQGKPRFVLDTHLGRLASYLRMMGFDTLYRNDYPDDELAFVSNSENRILLTRDIGLLKRSLVIYGYYMRETNPKKRILEVSRKYNLPEQITPFQYCMSCNGAIQSVAKADILSKITLQTARYYDQFYQCQTCQKIYWRGSHYQKMQAFIEKVVNEA